MTYVVIPFISLYLLNFIIMSTIKAKYVSVWDGGNEVKSKCQYNPDTKVVSDVDSVEVDGLDILEDVYVLLPDGTEVRDFINEDDLDEDIDPAGGYGLHSHI